MASYIKILINVNNQFRKIKKEGAFSSPLFLYQSVGNYLPQLNCLILSTILSKVIPREVLSRSLRLTMYSLVSGVTIQLNGTLLSSSGNGFLPVYFLAPPLILHLHKKDRVNHRVDKSTHRDVDKCQWGVQLC